MDRNIVYPGSIPQDVDILYPNLNAMVGIAALTAATLGTGTLVDGLACTPTTPASLTVVVGPGSITQLSGLDATAYGSLPANMVEQVVKTGINLTAVNFTFAVPASSGQSINYLIEAAFSETDADPAVLPYVNAANPSQAFSGPNNGGTAQNTQRVQRVQLQVKPGAAGASGTQTTPGVDTGWVGLYVVTVNYGQSAITNSSIVVAPGAPFIPYKLPALRPGFSSMQVFSSSGNFVVPNGVTTLRAELTGGGGAGGYHASMPGGGGGAGGRAVGIISGLTPGQVIPVNIGAGGVTPASPGTGGNGGMSTFGNMQAGGGFGGIGGTATGLISNAGGAGGNASGGQLNLTGSVGTDATVVAYRGGDGGGPGNGRGASGANPGIPASSYGGGGGGGGGSNSSPATGYPGGQGGGGLLVIEY
ncbi:hypothetical protein [Acidocella sp.]|uniref:glycine-rich domain-containing protein n=1 Tax=Acidocella sp. TaxID=50710 RepID=UPI00261BCFDE|nr:hypothetical protein [Acidocella sp.]